jgi:NADPH2:quinone reductase
MKAITIIGKGEVILSDVPKPEKVSPGHLIIKMKAMGINAGDKFFIGGNFPPGMFTQSLYDVAGVSGVGEVVAIGEGVPDKYAGKNVTVYRSLTKGNEIVGTWSEYAHLPYLQTVILPDDVDPVDYAGALVNIITAYAAWKQIVKEGHQGIVITAGNSDTGKAMLGFCQQFSFPVISIVRSEKAKQELEQLGATNILIHGTEAFQEQFQALAAQLNTTGVFDGVGGSLLSTIIEAAPARATIYAYGFLGGGIPVSFHTGVLIKGITIKGFNNFQTETVQDPQQLAEALEQISKVISLPHFKFPAGKKFSLSQFKEALDFSSTDGGKALLLAAE